ncbi:hypothetical protein BD414DRAFT_502363 [Trametes punicea]|nr:hypothetical protein BD414DRAFT_502363 [Trametes punicea]
MPDLFLADIEDDLARGTNLYLPRVMHRLLYTLSQDRKLTIDNWQSALRRQYLRRAPDRNPIGPEPKLPSRDSSIAPSEAAHEDANAIRASSSATAGDAKDPAAEHANEGTAETSLTERTSNPPEPKAEPQEDGHIPPKAASEQRLQTEEQEESKDWLDLPMLAKLDSLHLLTEWQFHNPYRVRQLMKDDDEAANWRIEPIGYDAKTNAYWLIGPDRLWIQRVPPKPPKTRNLKRKRPAAAATKKATAIATPNKAPESSSEDEEDEPVSRSKRSRTQAQAHTNGRSTRSSRRQTRASSPAPETSSPGKSARAAKVQANKKLDIQAKELAEYQRQLAQLAAKSKAATSPRASRRAPPSPAKRPVGTRVSARLRRSTRGVMDDDDDDEEWQQVPEEWLQDSASSTRRTSARSRAKGKARAVDNVDEPSDEEVDGQPEGEADADGEVEDGDGTDADAAIGTGARSDEVDGNAEVVTEDQGLLQKAGLVSDAVSELTDLSEEQDDVPMTEDDPEEPAAKKRPSRSRKAAADGGRKSAKQPRRAKPSAKEKPPPKEDVKLDPQEDEQEDELIPPLPEDFIEWEAIAVTLPEWERVADRFANATHYLEKALYKTLTQNIVPFVTAELREQEKRRRLEEAIVHRKRSSRIAMKEVEKEEARLAAKKRAEEEEKMARAKRQEARLKKEEAERAKRERAREQRRKEREERETRARAKAERAESKDAETSVARSTATPTVNGTQASSSVQPSRVVTPNGVRSPDWVLDCEICHKQGVNVDDGLAMVSCGSCNRWQHIPCHDLNDQRSGRPRRNWEEQQFYCSRCRQRATNGGAYSGYSSQGYPAASQYSWSQATRTHAAHKPPGMPPYSQASDMRYYQHSPVENGTVYPQQQQYSANHAGAAPYSRSSYPTGSLSISHYQPAVSSRGAGVASPPGSSTWSSNNGYASSAEQMSGRMQSARFVPQYGHTSNVYSSSRMPPAHLNATSPLSPYNAPGTMSAARWPNTAATNGYHASPSGNAIHTAAESLTYMHDAGSRYGGASGWSQQSYGQPQQQPVSQFPQSDHSSQHGRTSFPPGQLGVDPLAGQVYQTPRTEQQVGSSLPSGGSPFSFPS